MHKNIKTKVNLRTLKILGLVPVVWVALANFALVPHWISELIGLSPFNSFLPEPLIFTSIFVFFVLVAFLFFNRICMLVFEGI